MTPFKSGLSWLFLTLILPIILMLSLLLGSPAEQLGQNLSLTSGIFAYAWLLSNLYLASLSTSTSQLSSKLNTANQLLVGSLHKTGDSKLDGHCPKALAQVALLFGSLPLSMDHAKLSSASVLSSFFGQLALALLLMASSYCLLFWLVGRFRTLPSRWVFWFNALNALATVLVFVHVQAIDRIRHNLPFMASFYLLTLPILVVFLRKMADAKKARVTGQAASKI